jgi:hypothetical protein
LLCVPQVFDVVLALGMKHFLVVFAVILLSWTNAKAQDFSIQGRFGVVLDVGVTYPYSNSSIPLPFLGFQLGIEVGTNEWQFGLRATISDFFIFLNNLSFDVYLRYSQPDGISAYLGFGYRWNIPLLPIGNSVFTDWHGLLGIQFSSDFFIEFTPGVSSGTIYTYGPISPPTAQTRTPPYSSKEDVTRFILVVSVGWNWRF